MRPSAQNIADMEKYLDALQAQGIGAEFRASRFPGYIDFYVWRVDNPGNQLYLGTANTDTPKAPIVAPMMVLALATDSHYQEVIDAIKEVNGNMYEPTDHPFDDLRIRLAINDIIDL